MGWWCTYLTKERMHPTYLSTFPGSIQFPVPELRGLQEDEHRQPPRRHRIRYQVLPGPLQEHLFPVRQCPRGHFRRIDVCAGGHCYISVLDCCPNRRFPPDTAKIKQRARPNKNKKQKNVNLNVLACAYVSVRINQDALRKTARFPCDVENGRVRQNVVNLFIFFIF